MPPLQSHVLALCLVTLGFIALVDLRGPLTRLCWTLHLDGDNQHASPCRNAARAERSGALVAQLTTRRRAAVNPALFMGLQYAMRARRAARGPPFNKRRFSG